MEKIHTSLALLVPTFALPFPPGRVPPSLHRRTGRSPTTQPCGCIRGFGAELSPGGLSVPRHHRPVSYYALFQGWLLLSQPPGCLCTATALPTQFGLWDLSRRSGLFPSRLWNFAPTVSLPGTHHGIRRLVRVGKRQAPAPIRYATSVALLLPGAAPKCISGRTSYLRVRLAFHPYPQVIPALCNGHGFGPPRACSARFTLPMGSSPGFGSIGRDWPPFRTRFPSGSGCRCLSLATPNYSSAHSTKGTPSLLGNPKSSDRLEAHGFRICFTPLVGVLFTIPSRYWFTIGRWSYLALGGGPPSFPPNVTCWAVLTVPDHWRLAAVDYGTLTRSGAPFQHASSDASPSQRGVGIPLHLDRTTPDRQRIPARTPVRFGLCPVRSPLLRASSLFLGVLRCFSSPGSLPQKG